MSYSLEWTALAINQLSAAWVAAADQLAVTRAAYRLELALQRHPFSIGVPRTSSVSRTATDLPLGMDYEIIEDDKLVRIVRVWSLV